MEQNLLTKKKLKEKSIEYQISFANLLEGFLQETLMFQILETDFAKRLWLKNREAFDLDCYRKEWPKPLHFVYGQDDAKEQQVLDEYKIRYSDIDLNGHVNSVKYIEHILDLFPMEWFRQKTVKRFEVAYVAESYYGDTLSFYRQQISENEFDIEVKKNGQEVVVRSKVIFN